MIREDPIVLDREGAARFYAIISFGDETHLRFPKKERYIETLTKPKNGQYMSHYDRFGRISYSFSIPNYSSDEEWEKDMIAYQSAHISYIYHYLKDHYPNDPYAEHYRNELSEDYWVKKLNLNVDQLLR